MTKTASEAFIQSFEKMPSIDCTYYFQKNFFNDFFSNKTPTKDKILTETNELVIASNARNSIFKNLYLNESFRKADKCGFIAESLVPLYNIIKSSKESIDENKVAQLLFILHVSKGDFSNEAFKLIFQEVDQLKIITPNTNNEAIPVVEMNDFFKLLMKNKRVLKIISETVKEISNTDLAYDISSTKLKYFKIKLDELKGFAGVDTIYLNLIKLKYFWNQLDSLNYSLEDIIIFFKLSFTRLVIHELAHVALRNTIKDFNLSAPVIFLSSNKIKNSTIMEAGIIAEKKVFKERIDWDKTIENGFNIEYCKNFLNSFLKYDLDENVDLEFNLEISKVTLNLNNPIFMAIDSGDFSKVGQRFLYE